VDFEFTTWDVAKATSFAAQLLSTTASPQIKQNLTASSSFAHLPTIQILPSMVLVILSTSPEGADSLLTASRL
jgi:hypothetical protein